MENIILEALFSDCTDNFITPCEPEPYGSINIRFRTARDNVDKVILCITDNGILKEKHDMREAGSDSFFDMYNADITLDGGKLTYYFEVVRGEEICYYNKSGARYLQDDTGGYFDFVIIPGFKTPDWAKGAVMYQIYTDRFYNGDSSNDVVTDEYAYLGEHVRKAEDWYRYPQAMDVREFYGGDLQGVIEKLDYLKKLGVEVIYFNPLFVSPSNHKYDIQDYDYIDPHLGVIINDDDRLLPNWTNDNREAGKYIKRVTDRENLEASNRLFIKLVEKAHLKGIRVIVDGVFNHCGSFNKWMDCERIYEDVSDYGKGAYIDKDSEYNGYFRFFSDRWPYNGDFDGWWSHKTLPKLNYESSPELEEYILKVAAKWVSPPYNADGWRLDVAADLGYGEEYNHGFWKKFRNAVKNANPNAIILAEHYGSPRAWLNGDEWDTVMNYDAFMEPVSWFLTGMEKHSDGRSEDLKNNSKVFINTMRYFLANFTPASMYVSMNQLSNHDHSRFMTRTNETVGRTGYMRPETANIGINKAVMKEAVIFQMTWPGAPTLYYGDEVGLCGWTDPDNRRTYPWGREDFELFEFHRDMIRIHKESEALRKGSLKFIYENTGFLAYGRFTEDDRVVVVINNNQSGYECMLNVWEIGIYGDGVLERLMLSDQHSYNVGKLKVGAENGRLHVAMPPKSGAIYRMVKGAS